MGYQAPSEVIFSLTPNDPSGGNHADDDVCVFRYDHGPVSLKIPRRRGRPRKSNPRLASNSDDAHAKTFDFIPVTQPPPPNKTDNATPEEDRARDELCRVVRRRVMITYLRQKRQNSNKHKPLTQSDRPNPATQRHAIDIVPYANSVDPFNTAPIKLEPYMYDLLQFYSISVSKTLYSIEDKAEFNPMSEYWLPMAFHDSALLHVFIGFADFFMPNNRNIYVTSSEHQNRRWLGMRHLNEAISIVNKRVSDIQGSGVSNETLAAIATIAMIQKCNGMHEQWRIHMKGLEELVRARGGLNSLVGEPLIMGKLYRADLCGSIDAFDQPYFFSNDVLSLSEPIVSSDTPLPPGFQQLESEIGFEQIIKSCITRLDGAINMIWTLFSPYDNGRSSRAAQTRFWITTVQYTLLSIGSTYKIDDAVLILPEEVVRLVLLIYTAAMIDERPPGAPSCDMLITRFRNIWGKYIDGTSVKGHISIPTTYSQIFDNDFRVWAMFVAASVASPDSDLSAWCLSEVVKMADEMAIQTWEVASQLMKDRFLPLCDVRCEMIWNLAHNHFPFS